MATKLNENRMLASRILMVFVLLLGLLTTPSVPEGSVVYELSKLAGYILLAACAVGRIYSTAFIGGIKNKHLVTEGPYSACRNPLYFYSLLGAAGIGFLCVQLTLFVLLFGGFLWMYSGLIRREEEFLSEKFGKEFDSYKARVPRLLPRFKKLKMPEELLFQPRYFTFAVWDALWWFAPFPFFELSRILQHAGVIKPLAVLF